MQANAKHIRDALRKTQRDMANLTGLTERAIRSFESGQMSAPRVSTLVKLARAYGVTPDQAASLARGELIQWTPKLPASGFDLGRLKQQAATVVQDRDFSAGPDIHRMCTSDERSDVCVRHLSPPEWITDLAEGRDNPVIAERLGWLHQPEHAGAA